MALFLTLSNFVTALQPRKTRHRSTFIAVAALLVVSTYVFFARHPSLSSYALRRADTPAVDQIAVALEAMHNSRLSGGTRASRKHKHLLNKGVQLALDPAQELAAVSSFLASLPQNVIPLSVDPSVTIDPQLVLDFDTRNPRAQEEVQHMVDDVWSRNPIFLYSKLYSPSSREIKTMLKKMNIRPAPTIIDVDIRDDAEVLMPMMSRLTSALEFPILLVGGKYVGSIEDIRAMDKSGELRKAISASGAVIDGGKRKKHRK
ncbi:hypothetical protein BDZ94DRAFT_1165919 [Collybia nuda]|uniref:Glutaredoxin-like protein n=1 Tax=Collybia nuda TaxID=64659 RepID=A0A9P5Y2V9_9AGAR|nr:hypothetical protein BDZ94DRAFT_1165919 [Collybia nuda]